nr:hypothetical protein [Tanacetum cinerariifolium]
VYEPEVQKKSDSQNMAFISSSKKSSGYEDDNTVSVPTASTQVSPAGATVAPASVYEPEVQKKSDSQNMAFISSSKKSSGYEDDNTVSVPTASTQVSPAGATVAPASKTGKKISIQGIDVAGFDKSNVECFNCYKISHFARECRAPRSQDRGRRENYRQGSKVEEQTLKALMAIDGVG